MLTEGLVVLAALAPGAFAHVAAFKLGMYCKGGNNTAIDDQNTNLVVDPLYQLASNRWWMQADRGCDVVPPTNGDSLALPAGGSLQIELASNRAFTTLSYNGNLATAWTDGLNHPDDWHGPATGEGCLVDNPNNPNQEGGALHVQNEQRATGTAFAISYHSNIQDVNLENLVVFSVLPNSPWKRQVSYSVPALLPPCPPGGCYCAWLWVPDGCGTRNMYMQNFKCHVTGSTSTRVVGKAKPPVYCADNQANCVQGPKQMIVWHQNEGNNVVTPNDVTPPYNTKMGFSPGAQNDIFDPVKLGCYTDVADPRTLPNSVQISDGANNLTPEKCVTTCTAAGYKYAGVEYMSECWCGNTTPAQSLKISDSECNLTCTGSTQTCGAAWKIDVYRTQVPW